MGTALILIAMFLLALTGLIAQLYDWSKQRLPKEVNEMEEANWCCYIDPESGESCEADAELLIVSGYSPDDQTEACPLHVEDLFVDEPFNYVFPL